MDPIFAHLLGACPIGSSVRHKLLCGIILATIAVIIIISIIIITISIIIVNIIICHA